MSLTQDIAGLTQSVDELTEEVSGKMGQINSELVKFQNSFQPNLKKSLTRNIYFDGVNGDDSNDGTIPHPFKTLQGVKNQIVSGASYNFYINGTIELSGDVEFYNNMVFVYRQDKDIPAKIEQKVIGSMLFYNPNTTTSTLYDTAGSITLRGSQIHLYGVDVETAKSKNSPIFFSDSFISRDDFGSGLVSIFGNLHEEITGIGMSTVTLNDATFCTLASGPDLKNFTFYGVNFIRNSDGFLLNLDQSVSMVKINNSTFPEGLTSVDLIKNIQYKNGVATNILTSNQNLLNEKTVS